MTTLVIRFTFKIHSVVESTCTVYEYIQRLALYMFFFLFEKLNAEISVVIGRKLADFDVMEAEVQDCRRHWLHVCEESVNDRQKSQDSLRKYNFSALTVALEESNVSHQLMVSLYGKNYSVGFMIYVHVNV